MRFADPKILFILIWIVPAMAFFYFWAMRGQMRTMERFASRDLLPKIVPFYGRDFRKLRIVLNLTALLLIIIAAGRPQWGFFWMDNEYKGIDIIVAIDTSKSMLAVDIRPNRLSFTKTELAAFIKRLKEDRVGLLAFAGKAFLQCPLTSDYSGFLLALNDLNVETIPTGGTSFPAAIDEAVRSYKNVEVGKKALILITDGENTTGDIDKAIEKAKKNNIEISCIGIGTKEGQKIPIKDEDGNITYVKDEAGNIVESKLMEDILKKIANETGGIYIHASQANFGFDTIYEQRLSLLERKTAASDQKIKVYKERYQFPLALALLCLLTDLVLKGRYAKEKKKK